MTAEGELIIDERRKCWRDMKNQHRSFMHQKHGQLLSETEAMISLHRKSLIRLKE